MKEKKINTMHLAGDMEINGGIVGGLIIGATSTAMFYWTGRVTGISGIVEGMLIAKSGDKKSWTLSYLAGLISSGALLVHVYPKAFGATQLVVLSPLGYALAGLFTGFGTRMGSGCTSGHGICGLPRRSVRSLVAVLTFMTTGAISSYLVMNTPLKEMLGNTSPDDYSFSVAPTVVTALVGATLSNKNFILNKLISRSGKVDDENFSESKTTLTEHAVSFSSAVVFGLGLGISGMCNPSRVTNFLNFSGDAGWDPTLMGVMGGGVLFNLVSFHFMHKYDHKIPLSPTKSISSVLKMDAHPDNLKIDWKLIAGSALFGIGWGLGSHTICCTDR